MTQQRSIVLLGAGGHAAVLAALMHAQGCDLAGVCDPALVQSGAALWRDIPILGGDDVLDGLDPGQTLLVNGVGPQPVLPPDVTLRQKIQTRWGNAGFVFASLIHPSAWVASDVFLEDGVQIMAGAIVQPGCRLGAGTVINTGAVVDHDCHLGTFVHVAPSATLCGGVTAGDGAYIGSGAVAINMVRIGAQAVLAAGATLVGDLPAGQCASGTPARVNKL